MTQPGVSLRGGERSRLGAFVGAILGNAFEGYDTAIYGYLAAVMGANFFPGHDPTVQLLSSFALFGFTFCIRPVGSLIFGPLADRIGRTRVLVLMITLMAAATAAVGVLPTYRDIGVAATILLVVLRMLQGLAVGGEYGTATSFLTEYAKQGRRGFATSWYIFSSLLGFLLGSLAATALSSTLGAAALASWGWRLGFLVAAPLGLVALFIRLRIGESPDYASVAARRMTSKAPLRETFSHRRRLLLAAGVGTLHAVAFYMAFSYATSYIVTVAHRSVTVAFLSTVVASCAGLLLLPFGGLAADRWGRRPVLFAGAIWCLVTAYPAFLLMSDGGVAGAFGGQVVLAIGVAIFLSTSVAAIAELFPVRVRATGSSVAYNVSASLFGGTAPFIATLLVTTTRDSHSPSVFLAAAAAVALVSVGFIRTRELHTSLSDAELGTGAPAEPAR